MMCGFAAPPIVSAQAADGECAANTTTRKLASCVIAIIVLSWAQGAQAAGAVEAAARDPQPQLQLLASEDY